MHALEAYLIESHGSGRHEDGLSSDKAIVGVRFVSLRLPLPVPGQPLARVQRRLLAEYPDSEKQVFYHTPRSKLAERCGTRDEGGP